MPQGMQKIDSILWKHMIILSTYLIRFFILYYDVYLVGMIHSNAETRSRQFNSNQPNSNVHSL